MWMPGIGSIGPPIAARPSRPALLPLRRAANGEMKMNEQTTKLETAESDLKQLMADVSRAMEKAQEAVARLTSTVGAATAGTESTTKSR